jgi:hypothetical protein
MIMGLISLFELPWIVASTFLLELGAKALSKHDASISIYSKHLVQLLMTIVLSYKNPQHTSLRFGNHTHSNILIQELVDFQL